MGSQKSCRVETGCLGVQEICGNCGRVNYGNWRFCDSCGGRRVSYPPILNQKEHGKFTFRLPSWRLIILVSFLIVSVLVITPIQGEPALSNCPPPWRTDDPWFSTKVSNLVNYLWSQKREDLLNQFPQFQGESTQSLTPKDVSDLFTNNTDLAISMSQNYAYGYFNPEGINGTSGMLVNASLSQPYGTFWDPYYWGGELIREMKGGSTVHELWDCLRNHYGFDQDFSAASINLGYTLPYGRSTANDLDPAVYGAHPYVIAAPEPEFVLLPTGHVAFGVGGCPLGALETFDSHGNLTWGMSTAGCFGGGVLLIVPDDVVKVIGMNPILGTEGFLQIVFGGNGDPALIHFLTGEASDSSYQARLSGLETNWLYWKNSYWTLINALKNYHVPNLNWNFSRFIRNPLDTRFPQEIERKIIWDSFPSPLEQLMPAYAGANVTLHGFIDGSVKFSGEAMAQSYAVLVAEYLAKNGLFTWAQDSIIRPWLSHWIGNVGTLPNFDIKADGHYVHFQYHDAYKQFGTLTEQPQLIATSSLGITSDSNLSSPESVVSFTGDIVQAQELDPVMVSRAVTQNVPSDIVVPRPPFVQINQTANPPATNPPWNLAASIASVFAGGLVFVGRTGVQYENGREDLEENPVDDAQLAEWERKSLL